MREELKQLLDQGRPVQRVLLRDHVPLDQIRQGLIHRLHAELLAGGDRGIHLVNLLLADEVADGRRGGHDLQRQHAPAADLGNEGL